MLRIISLCCLFGLLLACNNSNNGEPQASRQAVPVTQQDAKIILVTGVTGRQGGAVARALLDSTFHVRGLSRHPQSERGKAMTALGVDMVQGDFEDTASLDAAMKNVYGVFSVQNYWESGYEAEVRQGKNVADAAKRAQVKHLIYSSVASADLDTGIPHFESKREIELYIQSLNLPFTIFRPVSFMENWEYARESIVAGKIETPFSPATRRNQISVRDIGRFVALAFAEPEHWLGRSLDIAGEQFTMQEAVNTISRISGSPVEYVQIPWDVYRKTVGQDMYDMDRWIEETGYDININMVHSELPGMLSLEDYLYAAGW